MVTLISRSVDLLLKNHFDLGRLLGRAGLLVPSQYELLLARHNTIALSPPYSRCLCCLFSRLRYLSPEMMVKMESSRNHRRLSQKSSGSSSSASLPGSPRALSRPQSSHDRFVAKQVFPTLSSGHVTGCPSDQYVAFSARGYCSQPTPRRPRQSLQAAVRLICLPLAGWRIRLGPGNTI